MDPPPKATPPRLKAQPNLAALDVPPQPTEPLIHPIPALRPLATLPPDCFRIQQKTSSSSATPSSTLSSPAGRLASRASVRRLSGAEYNEEVASACSSGEFEELVRKLNTHARETGDCNHDYTNSPTFHVLQSLRRARTQELVHKITRLRLIGQGGYGRVYQGMWQGAVVAVKFLVTDNASSLERSLTEAVLSKVFMHPHVVQTFTCKMVTWEELPQGTVQGDPALQVEGSAGSATSASTCSSDTDEIDGAEVMDEDPEEAAAIETMGPRFVSGDGFGAPMPETGSEGYLTYEQALGQLRVQPGQFVTQIIMEFCDKGSLQSAINRGIFKEDAKWGPRTAFRALLRTAREVALGMVHIHAGNVVHGDLKPANVLLKSSRIDRRGFQSKVADFGLARVDKPLPRDPANPNAPAPEPPPENDFMGTVTHMAPEALGGSVTKAADVFAFGVMLWEMYTGEQPYVDLPQFAIMVGVQNGTLRPEWPPSAPARLVRLSSRCWEQDPAARPPMEYVLKKLTQIELALRHEAKRERFASSRRASMVSDASSAALDIAALQQDLAAAEQALAEQQAAQSPRLHQAASRSASQTAPSPLHRLSSSSELPSPLLYRRVSNDYCIPHAAAAGPPAAGPPPAVPIPHVPTIPTHPAFAYSPPNPSPISCLRQHSDAFSLASTCDNPQTPTARAAYPRSTNDLLPASSFSPTASPLGRAPSGIGDATLPPSPSPGLSSLSPFSTMGQNLIFDASDAHIPGSPFSTDLPLPSRGASYPQPFPAAAPNPSAGPDSISTTLHTQSPSLATFSMRPLPNPSLPSPHSKSPLPPLDPIIDPVPPCPPSPKPRFSLKSLLPSSAHKHRPQPPAPTPDAPLPRPPSFFANLCGARIPRASTSPPETRPPSPAPTANPTFTFPQPIESSKALVRSLITTFARPDKPSPTADSPAAAPPADRPFLSLVARTHLDPSVGDDSDALKIASRTCSSIKDQSPFALVQRSGASELSPFAPRTAAPSPEATA